MFDGATSPLTLDLLILPETTLILVSAIIEPLRAANRIVGKELYAWRLFSPNGDQPFTGSGIPIPVEGAFDPKGSADPLIVAASYNWQAGATSDLLRKLHLAGRHRPMIVGVDSGVWLLARADLLNEQRATTHWEDADEFRLAFPRTELLGDRFVVGEKRITSGGPLPTLDLMLDIIRRRQGYPLALEVSRLFIYEPAAAPSSRSTSAAAVLPSASGLAELDKRVDAAIKLMARTLDAPLSCEALASRVGVTARHLQTLFHQTLGTSTGAHYRALRLNAARRLVIETRRTSTDIASTCGFTSPAAFARAYRDQFGESPRTTRGRLRPTDLSFSHSQGGPSDVA